MGGRAGQEAGQRHHPRARRAGACHQPRRVDQRADQRMEKAPPITPAGGSAAVKALVPWLVAVAFFMEALDPTILNPAVRSIAAALGIAPLSMKSVLSSYTLSMA